MTHRTKLRFLTKNRKLIVDKLCKYINMLLSNKIAQQHINFFYAVTLRLFPFTAVLKTLRGEAAGPLATLPFRLKTEP